MDAPQREGARAVVRKNPSRVRRIELDDPGIVVDIDGPEDYRRFV
jgi:CTP:molybdopterin cytidylyltransferase MocA